MLNEPDAFSYAPFFESLEKLGLKTYEVHRLTHVSGYHILEMEKGKAIPISTLCQIAYYLGLELSDIIEYNHRPADEVSSEIKRYLRDKEVQAEMNRKHREEMHKEIDLTRLIKVPDSPEGPPPHRYLCPDCRSYRVEAREHDLKRGLQLYICHDCGWSAWTNFAEAQSVPQSN